MDTWTVTPIAKRTRLTKASLAVIISLAIAIWLWTVQYTHHVLLQNWYVPAILPVVGAWIAWVVYRKTERRQLTFEWQRIPTSTRIKRGSVIVFGTLIFCGLAWAEQYSEASLTDYWWYVWPAAAIGLSWAAVEFARSRKKILTPEAQAESERLAAEKKSKEQERAIKSAEQEERWYFRYPIAAVSLFAAYWLYEKDPRLWWLAVLLVIVAAFQARELSLLILAGVVAYWVIQGVAALPVSVAIIIGAFIIAAALQKRR